MLYIKVNNSYQYISNEDAYKNLPDTLYLKTFNTQEVYYIKYNKEIVKKQGKYHLWTQHTYVCENNPYNLFWLDENNLVFIWSSTWIKFKCEICKFTSHLRVYIEPNSNNNYDINFYEDFYYNTLLCNTPCNEIMIQNILE